MFYLNHIRLYTVALNDGRWKVVKYRADTHLYFVVWLIPLLDPTAVGKQMN